MKSTFLVIILIGLAIMSLAQSLPKEGALFSADGKYVVVEGNDFWKDTIILKYRIVNATDIPILSSDEKLDASQNVNVYLNSDSNYKKSWILYSRENGTYSTAKEIFRIIIEKDSIYQFRQECDTGSNMIVNRHIGTLSKKLFFDKYNLSISPVDLTNELAIKIDTLKSEGVKLLIGDIDSSEARILDSLRISSNIIVCQVSCFFRNKLLFSTTINNAGLIAVQPITKSYNHWNETNTKLFYDNRSKYYLLRLGIKISAKEISVGHGENIVSRDLMITETILTGTDCYNKISKLE